MQRSSGICCLVVVLLAIAANLGCRSDVCTRHSDCGYGFVCNSIGLCNLGPVDGSLGDAAVLDGNAGDDAGASDGQGFDAGDGGGALGGDAGDSGIDAQTAQ